MKVVHIINTYLCLYKISITECCEEKREKTINSIINSLKQNEIKKFHPVLNI